jgi:hypothetical protein
MRCSASVKAALLALSICLDCVPALAGEYGIVIEHAQLQRKNANYVLDADIAYRLTPKVLKTLQNGIPLEWTLRVQVYRQRNYLWDQCVADVEHLYRLRYQALMNAYQVRDESRGEAGYFTTLAAALEAMGVIRDLPLPELPPLAKDASYSARIRMQLDKEALPLPLRPVSYVSSDWYLSSGWYSWSVTQ